MKKLLTVIVIIMLIATLAISARSGDKYDLKKLIEWQNTIYLEGIVDTSLTGCNDVLLSDGGTIYDEVNTEPIPKKQSTSYYEKETGGVVGMMLIDEFRCTAKLPTILFFVDAVKMNVSLSQRLYLVFGDTDHGNASLFGGGIGLGESQYRSYLTCKWSFGGDPVKYDLTGEIQARLVFSGAGIANVRVIPYIGNKITIAKILEIQANIEQTLRWDLMSTTTGSSYTTVMETVGGGATNSNTSSNYNFDFRIGSPGHAGGGYHYLDKAPTRAKGYDIGPISLAWRIRSRFDLCLNHQRWKDTDPGSDNDNNKVSNSEVQKGIAKDWKFRTEEDIWVNVLKDVKLIDLNVGGYHFLMMNTNYAYNWPETIQIYQDIGAGVELVLDKAFFIGLQARIILNDFVNAWGVPMNGKEGDNDEWTTYSYGQSNQRIVLGVAPDTEAYSKIFMGNGRIGPHIYVGVVKDAFQWVLNYTGLANFRTYDINGDNLKAKYDPRSTGYWNWRNEIETWVKWLW